MSLGSLEWGRTSPTGGRALRFSGLVIDMPLLVLLLATASVGFVVLYSALGANTGLFLRQGVRFAFGMAAFFVLSQVPPRYSADLDAVGVFPGCRALDRRGDRGRDRQGRAALARSRHRHVPAVRAAEARGADDGRLVHARPAAAADIPPSGHDDADRDGAGLDDRGAAGPRHRDARDRGRRPRDPARRNQRARDPRLRGARGERRARCSGTTCGTTSARECSCS